MIIRISNLNLQIYDFVAIFNTAFEQESENNQPVEKKSGINPSVC